MAETYQRNEGPTSAEILAQVNQVESRILELANQLDAIRRTDNNPFSSQPPPFLTETVPLAQSVEIISATQEVGTTHVAMSWTKPPRNDIDHFEIWAKNVAFASEQPFKVTDATDAPATFSLTADTDTGVVLFVRTVLKNGLGSDLNSSPTVATNITLEDPSITDASQIADGIIGDSHFDRVSANAIQIVNADIVNLQATKITAGTLAAGVILASNINATQINAGTMSAVNVSAGTYSLISGNEQMLINGTVGFNQVNSSTNAFTKILGGLLSFGVSGTNYGDFGVDSEGGVLTLRNTSGANKLILALTPDVSDYQSGAGIVECVNTSGSVRAALGVDDSSTHGRLDLYGSSGQVLINGVKVLGAQEADPGASPTTDQLRNVLLAHGLIG